MARSSFSEKWLSHACVVRVAAFIAAGWVIVEMLAFMVGCNTEIKEVQRAVTLTGFGGRVFFGAKPDTWTLSCRLSGTSVVKKIDFEGRPLPHFLNSVVSECRYLDTLHIGHSQVDDELIRGLANCQYLRELFAGGNSLSDNSMFVLGSLGNLELLDLRDTHITDAALEDIGKIQTLNELILDGTDVDGSGFVSVNIPNLRVLSLEDTNTNDETATALAEMKSLRSLYIRRTKVTGAKADWLRSKLPNCDVRH